MNILHVGKFYSPHRGGMETALRNLAELGQDLGHSVSCVVAHRKGTPTPDDSNIEVTAYPAHREIFSAPLPWKLLRHDFSRAEILHVHLPNPVAELAILLHGRHSRLVPFVHALPLRQGLLGKIWLSTITRPLLNRSEMILVSNPHMLTAFPMLQRWKNKTHVVPFSVDTLAIDELEKTFELRKDSKVALAIGRLVSYKGFDVLLRAWHLAQLACPDFQEWRLDIIGEGRELAKLQRLIANLNLGAQIRLLGNCSEDEKQKSLKRASLFVAPSLNAAESFGISVLEAMAFALPVITTDLKTGLQDLARRGACGAQTKAGDSPSLAEALIRVTGKTAAERENMGRANFSFQLAKYNRAQSEHHYKTCLYQTQAERPAFSTGSI